MKALIKDGVVIQIADAEFPVHKSFIWKDASEEVKIGWLLKNDILEAPPISVKTKEEILAEYENALIGKFNEIALLKNYDNQYSLLSYINSTNSIWASEAQKFNAWRDSCWIYVLNLKSEVESGAKAPTLENFINGLPTFSW